MPRQKYTDKDIEKAVKTSYGIREVLTKLGLRPTGGNYKVFHNNVARLNLDITHFKGHGWSRGKKFGFKPRRSLEDVLVVNSPHKTTYSLKLRLIREGLFEEKCYRCNRKEWEGVVIPLELEHINGVNNDNRVENLTLLCPNCHALTPTYRGKNKKQSNAGLVEQADTRGLNPLAF